MKTLIKEACVENFTFIPTILEAGANRIELCDNLAEGGTTVSVGVLKKSISFCHEKGIPVMSIIRPRGGDFVYTSDEKEIMYTDISLSVEEKVDGLVLGCLQADGWVDEKTLEKLINLTPTPSLTFHMAFDQIPKQLQKKAIDYLADAGFSRILTHGGAKTKPIQSCIACLKELTEYANDRIIILPGGGVTWENCEEIAKAIGAHEVHGTNIVKYHKL